MENLLLQPGPFGECVGIKLGRQTPLEFRFQDVATDTILQKPSLVYVHLFGGSLEVQRHWKPNLE